MTGKATPENVQVIIPMTGNGSRFKAAGFSDLKPFIKVHGTPMVEWVVRMFDVPGQNVSFVCRGAHLKEDPGMRAELGRIAPGSRVLAVEDWQKKGPVFDILCMADQIDDKRPTLVSYCDYFMQWNYASFITQVLAGGYEGAVPCYTGFHPNLLPEKNVYASCKVHDDETLIEIREKFSWTADKKQSRHSPGVYYFRTGALMKTHFARLVDSDQHINGEFYASMPYNFMVADGLRVWCPNSIDWFCQWGTPEDLKEYLYWVDLIRARKEAAQ
jgi:hypothetical protein